MTVQSHTLFCFGMGYVAQRLVTRHMDRGWQAIGTSRTDEKALALQDRLGAAMLVMREGDGEIYPDDHAHWLISIPPTERGCPAFQASGQMTALAGTITYLSTTGVYGDRGGDWVYEDTAPTPQSERAKRRVVAEQQWASVGANIVRLPGIYGPGRSVFDRLRSGRAKRIIKSGQVFSRCHVDDIARGLKVIIARGITGQTLHLCDEEPAPPQDVTAYGADLLGVSPPPATAFENAELSDMARSFYSECKRVSNTATKAKLGWEPEYPSYREGLAAILAEEAR